MALNENYHQSSSSPPKTLAIDFGTKRIGLAVSHAKLAIPLEVVEYEKIEEALSRIEDLAVEHQVELLLLGISEQEMAAQTRSFGELLTQHLGLPLEYADETLSSNQVRAKLKERGKRIIGPIDHLAASLFLEEWMG